MNTAPIHREASPVSAEFTMGCETFENRQCDDRDRPDVAIEVVWSSGGINELEVYRKLGVREVCFYERGTLRFFTLRTLRAALPRS
jgi:hypothetical protein